MNDRPRQDHQESEDHPLVDLEAVGTLEKLFGLAVELVRLL
ncbi:hypothetical protein [Nocardia mexicana]|nr:hypothetical protein [Nocardia mexicana]